jgi:hypothetical protein
MIMDHKVGERTPELPLTQRNYPIHAFLFDGPNKALPLCPTIRATELRPLRPNWKYRLIRLIVRIGSPGQGDCYATNRHHPVLPRCIESWSLTSRLSIGKALQRVRVRYRLRVSPAPGTPS